MEKIPTAEELIRLRYSELVKTNKDFSEEIDEESLREACKWMIEFTKMHVKAALEAVKESGENCFGDLIYRNRGENIPKIYPLKNIQ